MKQGFWKGLTLGILAAGLAGCVESVSGDGGATTREISYGIATDESRAVIDDENPMTEFAVWGYYMVAGVNDPVEVFGQIGTETDKQNTGVRVSNNSGSWQYEGGTRYWREDGEYVFHAVHPMPESEGVKHVVEYKTAGGSSALSIIDFDATVGTDLLYAEAKDVTYAGTTGGEVPLTFSHLLARVEFVAKLDAAAASSGVTATVNSAQLYGMYKQATFSSEGWPAPANNGWIVTKSSVTNSSTSRYADNNSNVNVTKDGVNVFGKNVFVFPGSVEDGYHFDVNYMVGGKRKEVNVNLADLAEKTWEPGKVYRYTLTVTAEASLKLTVTVLDWEDESASVSW